MDAIRENSVSTVHCALYSGMLHFLLKQWLLFSFSENNVLVRGPVVSPGYFALNVVSLD